MNEEVHSKLFFPSLQYGVVERAPTWKADTTGMMLVDGCEALD